MLVGRIEAPIRKRFGHPKKSLRGLLQSIWMPSKKPPYAQGKLQGGRVQYSGWTPVPGAGLRKMWSMRDQSM